MFERYVVINEAKIICGQTASGTWYCKELPAINPKEADVLIGEINKILNKHNKNEQKDAVDEKRKKIGQ